MDTKKLTVSFVGKGMTAVRAGGVLGDRVGFGIIIDPLGKWDEFADKVQQETDLFRLLLNDIK